MTIAHLDRTGVAMHELMEERLRLLRIEFETGQRRHQALLREQETLQETMMRISGAIQVLEELLRAQVHTSAQSEPHSIDRP